MEMNLEQVTRTIERARDAITVQRVYGDPIERDGTVIVPAAVVMGGGGGGGGSDNEGNGGGGTGFGLRARPVGAFVLRGNDVRWEPVVDRERQLLVNVAVVGAALLVLRSLLRGRGHR